jgi:hypothetical protein
MSSRHAEAPSLRHIQEWMAARLLGPASGELLDSGTELDEWLRVPPRQRAAGRLRVYQDGYPARLRDSLAESYPAMARLLGDYEFSALAYRYAASVALTSYNLNDAGAQMSDFLRCDALSRERPFLADLATLEWRVALAFHAAERPPLDPRTLGWGVDEWASAVLQFQPSVAVVSSPWPVLDLWAPRDMPNHPTDIDFAGQGDDVIVRRAGFVVRCESVSAHEALALYLLLGGESLAETVAQLDGIDTPDTVMAWFSRWTSAGMIAAAVTSTEK